MANGFLVFLWLATAYMVLVYVLARRGWLARFGMGLWGPAVMMKTTRGRGLIEKLARPRRFWNAFADVGVAVTLLLMVVMVAFLAWIVPFLTRVPAEAAPRASEILAIPGVNPLIPLWYGLVALIVALVIHEFAHGILARANDLKVKSLGLLFLIVPIGAFVEPDEEELKAAGKRRRMRVYAAGVSVNLAAALVVGVVLSAGMFAAAEPAEPGVGIAAVVKDSPADAAGVRPGWVLTAINGTAVASTADFQRAMCGKGQGEVVTVTFLGRGDRNVTLANRSDFDERPGAPVPETPDQNPLCPAEIGDAFRTKGFLGVQHLDYAAFLGLLRNPGRDLVSFVSFISLPFTAKTFAHPLTSWLDAPGGEAFWVTANVLYWLFWINLMLGLTNALPVVILDGGHLFRDAFDAVVRRVRPGLGAERRERVARGAATFTSLLVLVLVLAQLVIPRLGLG